MTFGDILPFLGFRTFPVDPNGDPIVDGSKWRESGYESPTLIFQWGRVLIPICTTRVYRRDEQKDGETDEKEDVK